MTPRIPQKVITKLDGFEDMVFTAEYTHPLDEHLHTSPQTEHLRHEEHGMNSPFQDQSGTPLAEGAEYEMFTGDGAIPDRITINRITPHKMEYTMHSGDMDYQADMTPDEIQNQGYAFKPADDSFDSEDKSLQNASIAPEHPIRPGQDATPQVDDLSVPSTRASHLAGSLGDPVRDQQAQDLLG